MTTVTFPELEARLREIVSEVERDGQVVEVERDGQVVVRIVPASRKSVPPWEALRGSGVLLSDPEEAVLRDEDFEASR